MANQNRIIGVLALQGGFASHERALFAAGFQPRAVRVAGDLHGLSGLILPGGESTTQLRMLARHGLEDPLRELVASGIPILATCAGLILAAAQVESPAQPSYGFLDVTVTRNGWGRQVDSFEAIADDGVTPLVFIRAPRIRRTGPTVQIMAALKGEPVMVRQGNVVGATFHPELAPGGTIHARVFA
jgi:5'-phosphate synthase pdxT subunit